MEYLVLDSYKLFRKDKQVSFKDWIKELKTSYKLACITMLIAGSFAIIMTILWAKYKQNVYLVAYLVGLIILLGSVIFLALNPARENNQNGSEKIEKKNDYYKEVLRWLQSIGYDKKNQIKQLCCRCEKIIVNEQLEQEKEKKIVDKVLNVCIFPIGLAIVSWILELKMEVKEILILCVLAGLIMFMIYIMVIILMKQWQSFVYSLQRDMQHMVNDLHGVLDRCFEIEDNDIN